MITSCIDSSGISGMKSKLLLQTSKDVTGKGDLSKAATLGGAGVLSADNGNLRR